MAVPPDSVAVRLVEVTIPTGRRTAILDALDDEGIDYVVTEDVSGRDVTGVVEFPLPSGAVEPVLDRLREEGLGEDSYTIVLDAETVVSRRFDRLVERYGEDGETPDRIAREEIVSRVDQITPELHGYTIMVVASVAIATAGVLLDSAAIVVGSMVIAPLIGPAMATSLGTVVQDRELFVRGIRLQVFGAVLAVVTAAGFAWFVKTVHLVPPGIDLLGIGQVRERLSPDFLSLVVALGAGVAGAYSLSIGVSTALVGVMIAAALVPPMATIGIGIAWGSPSVVLGSSVLVLVNFVSINIAALVVLWYQGYRPGMWFRESAARAGTRKLLASLVAAAVLLSVFLGAVTYSAYSGAVTEDHIRSEVEAVVDDEPTLGLIDVAIETEQAVVTRQPFLLHRPTHVTVSVSRPVGAGPYPDLATRIAAAIESDRAVEVEVRFVEVQRAN